MSFGSQSLPKATPEQIARWVDCFQKGCVVHFLGDCSGNLEQHHLKSGNLRMGHWFTVCLCVSHHNRAAELAKKYGNETLMYFQDNLLGYITPRERQRRKSSSTASPSKCFKGFA